MKTEKEKMLSNELYNHKDAELTKERNHAYIRLMILLLMKCSFLKLIWKQTLILKSSSVRRLAIHIISISLTNMVYSGNLNRDMIIKI